jgi:hypothetical protein
MSVLVGLSLTNHCLDHSEIFFKSVFSYISAREQQVIIKNVISEKGNLKAGVPQGSTPWPPSLLSIY